MSAPSGLSPGGEAALAALVEDELKQALETIGIGEYDQRVRGELFDVIMRCFCDWLLFCC